MSSPGDDIMRKSMKKTIFWLMVSLAIAMAVNFIGYYLFGDAAFPWTIVALVGIFILMSYAIQRRELQKAGLLPSKSGKGYSCHNCGSQYKGDHCPNCGTRGGKMKFD